MDGPSELTAFLRSRRARVTPEGRELPAYPGRRRVPGLRREELAQLAGVSVSYYTSLEQGRALNASPEVLRGIARALDLDEHERAHLADLVSSRRRRPASRRRAPERVDAQLAALLESIPAVPALVTGRSADILAWNSLGHALFAGHLPFESVLDPERRPNTARSVFLDPHSRGFFSDWTAKAQAVVAHLRVAAGKHPDDSALAELIGELSMQSKDFAQMWAGHGVKPCGWATTRLDHPLVGALTVTQQVLLTAAPSDQVVILVTAGPGSPSAASLQMLGSLTASVGGPGR